MSEKEYYKSQITEMVQNINRCDILVYIYKAICGVIDEDCEEEQ